MPDHLRKSIVNHVLVVVFILSSSSTAFAKQDPPPQDIERNIKASMIIYVLGELCMSFLVGMTMLGAEESANVNPQSAPDMSFQEFTAIILVLGVVIWGFRFFWMYVPVIMGRHPLDYLKIFSGFSSSFLLIGVWLLCLVPISLVMLVLSEVFGLDLMGVSDGSVALNGVSMAVLAVFDYFMVLVASLAVLFNSPVSRVCSNRLSLSDTSKAARSTISRR